ncbi:hypothetical protein WA171_000068 [Blastocystis sp. BT1]
MNVELFKRIAPKAYYGKFLEQSIRPDGRNMDTGRGIVISEGHIGTADGSSFVRLGNTGIICGIKLEFLPSLEASETSGKLDINVHLTPLCSPNMRLGKPPSQCYFYSQTLTRIFEKYVIDAHDLYAKEVNRVIVAHADLICIDYEGSVFDACSLALLAALMNLRIPTVSLKEEELVFDYDHPRSLQILNTPISISFGLFEDFEVMDPDVFEEDIIEDSVTFVLGEDGKVLSLVKPGGKPVKDEMLMTLRSKASDRYNEVYEVFETYRKSLGKEMELE